MTEPVKVEPVGYLSWHKDSPHDREFMTLALTEADKCAGYVEQPVYFERDHLATPDARMVELQSFAWLIRRNLEDGDRRMAVENCNNLISYIETGAYPNAMAGLRTLSAEIDAALSEPRGTGGVPLVRQMGASVALAALAATEAQEEVRRVPTSREVMLAGGVDPDAPFEIGPFPSEMRQALPTPPTEPLPEDVERVARALYAKEKERSDRCDAIISAARGKKVAVSMEPWEECWQSFYDDARAAILALSQRPATGTADRGEVERPETVARFLDLSNACTGAARMFSLDEAKEVVDYIRNLEAALSATAGRSEREAVVEFVRSKAAMHFNKSLSAIADAIERGEHQATDWAWVNRHDAPACTDGEKP